jgi:SdpC family antimicrobial peptide
MSTNTHLRTALAIVLAIALVIGPNATRAALARSHDDGATVAATYDGETIFSGIFFRTGPVAALLPERALPAATADEARTLIAAIDAADPTFFRTFAQDIATSDRVVIREALNGAARVLRAAVMASYGGTHTDCAPGCAGDAGTLIILDNYLFVVMPLVVILTDDYARVATESAAYEYELWRFDRFAEAVLMDHDSQLAMDAFVDALARTFGG